VSAREQRSSLTSAERQRLSRLRRDVNEVRLRQDEAERREAARVAMPAKRPGLQRPGQRQLRKPNFLAAATAGVSSPDAAAAALAARRELEARCSES